MNDYVEYKNPFRFFVRGSQRNSKFHEEKVSFSVVVLRIDTYWEGLNTIVYDNMFMREQSWIFMCTIC